MEGFALLLGHLIGDYVFQEDWQAANKANPHPGPDPAVYGSGLALRAVRRAQEILSSAGHPVALSEGGEHRAAVMRSWLEARRKWWVGHLACTVHCLLYTLACLLTSFWFLPAWAYPVIFLAHWPVDRFRLARVWMTRVNGQKAFATGPLAPWSVIVVDNTLHLAVLFALGLAARAG